MSNRGQIETLGLVVIIILVMFLGFIFLKYSGKEDISSEDKFLSIKANNFLSSIKQLTIGNNNFEYFAIDCCGGNSLSCTSVSEAVVYSMGYLEEASDFKLTCFSGSEYPVVVGDCEFGVTSETFVLSSGDRISLKICRE